MITAEYCATMARYNVWQNKQLIDMLDDVTDAEIRLDRGAFFGSIIGTLSHLIFGDHIWISRFDGGDGPDVGISDSAALVNNLADWRTVREPLDARILAWAEGLKTEDLNGDLHWYSGAEQRRMSKSLALCIVQLFNHQTHHRGQVHAMITSTGRAAPVSDIPFMPMS